MSDLLAGMTILALGFWLSFDTKIAMHWQVYVRLLIVIGTAGIAKFLWTGH